MVSLGEIVILLAKCINLLTHILEEIIAIICSSMASQVPINSLNLSLNFKPRFENLKPRFKKFKPRFERKSAH